MVLHQAAVAAVSAAAVLSAVAVVVSVQVDLAVVVLHQVMAPRLPHQALMDLHHPVMAHRVLVDQAAASPVDSHPADLATDLVDLGTDLVEQVDILLEDLAVVTRQVDLVVIPQAVDQVVTPLADRVATHQVDQEVIPQAVDQVDTPQADQADQADTLPVDRMVDIHLVDQVATHLEDQAVVTRLVVQEVTDPVAVFLPPSGRATPPTVAMCTRY